MGKINVFLVPDQQERAMAVIVMVEEWVLRSDSAQADWRKIFARTQPFVGLPLVFGSLKSSGDIALYGERSLVRQLERVASEIILLNMREYDVPGVA